MKRANTSSDFFDNKKTKSSFRNPNDYTFKPINPIPPQNISISGVPIPPQRVTAPKTGAKLGLFIPGVDVPFIPEEQDIMEREQIRYEQDKINDDYKKIYSPYHDNYGNKVRWVNSPRQTYSPYEYTPNMVEYENAKLTLGGKKYKKKLIIINDKKKRKSLKNKRKSKRKSLKKRRKTRRK